MASLKKKKTSLAKISKKLTANVHQGRVTSPRIHIFTVSRNFCTNLTKNLHQQRNCDYTSLTKKIPQHVPEVTIHYIAVTIRHDTDKATKHSGFLFMR